MPLKPHPTDPDKMVYVSRQYDMPDTPTARAYLAKVLEDDDTQVYKKPWVGLTDEEVDQFHNWKDCTWSTNELVRHVEATLRSKNT